MVLRNGSAWLFAALALIFAAPAFYPQSAPARVLRIQLAQYDWVQPPKYWNSEHVRTQQNRLTIDSQGRVLVSFTERGPSDEFAAQGHPSLRFRILRFDADGKLDLSLSLPTDNWWGNGIFLDPQGRIIAITDEKVQMSQLPVESGDQVAWKVLTVCGTNCKAYQSVDRRTLLLSVTVFNYSAFAIDGTVTQCAGAAPFGPPDGISEHFMYRQDIGVPPQPLLVLSRQSICHPGQPVALPIRTQAGGMVLPLNDNLYRFRQAIYRDDGTLVQKLNLHFAKDEADDSSGIVGVSQNLRRFIVLAVTKKGRHEWLDMPGHVTAERAFVYDAVTNQEIGSLPFPISGYAWEQQFAISPSGDRYAVFTNGLLLIADVPPAAAPSATKSAGP